MPPAVSDAYSKYYASLGFERLGLLAALRAEYACTSVLYPGCSFHIAPSFYFPHVVYVDQSLEVASLFADLPAVQDFIRPRRHYKRSAYIRFLALDYTVPLPLTEKFDLLLSLYAPGAALACSPYLKRGGLLLSNDHQEDARQTVGDPTLSLVAGLQKKGSGYHFMNAQLASEALLRRSRRHSPDSLRQTSRGLQFREESEQYFIFRKISI